MMPTSQIIFIAGFILYLVTYFWFSQKIYSKNWFIQALIVFILIALILFYFNRGENSPKAFYISSILHLYLAILFCIKKFYKSVNHFFIKKKWVAEKFYNKDFTYAETSEWGDGIWDKKRCSSPSWFDYLLTAGLLLLPMLLSYLIGKLILLVK